MNRIGESVTVSDAADGSVLGREVVAIHLNQANIACCPAGSASCCALKQSNNDSRDSPRGQPCRALVPAASQISKCPYHQSEINRMCSTE